MRGSSGEKLHGWRRKESATCGSRSFASVYILIAIGRSKRARAPSIKLVDHDPGRIRINIYPLILLGRLHQRLLIGLILGSVASVDLVVSHIRISVKGLSMVLCNCDLSCGQGLH